MKVLNKKFSGVPTGAILVDRTTPYGNPYKIGPGMNRDLVCDLYILWFWKQPDHQKWLNDLKGHDLVCHCAPLRCHADFLLKEANK